MPLRERLEAFWKGEKPDRVPYTSYRRFVLDLYREPGFRELVRDGFGVTWNVPTYKMTPRRAEHRADALPGGLTRNSIRTPLGEIHELNRKGKSASYLLDWPEKRFLETREDYRVMTWAVEDMAVEPAYDEFHAATAGLEPWEVPLSLLNRSPFQAILVDWAGLENFAVHVFEFEEEVRALHAALWKQFRRKVEILAGGPGTYVSCLENFSAETMGPKRFEEFLLPVYDECFRTLHEAGKIVGCHYDGRTRAMKDLIRRAPFDVVEAFTRPPEGDFPYAEARAAWPEKRLWANLNVALYERPPAEVRSEVLQILREASPDGRLLALECSEDRPPNWQASMRAVLDATREAA